MTTTTNTKDALGKQQQPASRRPVASAAVISEKHDEEDEDGKQIIEAGEEGDSDPEVIFRQSQSNPSSATLQPHSMNAGNISSLRAVRTGSRASQGSLREGNIKIVFT